MSKKINVRFVILLIFVMFLIGCINKVPNKFDVKQLTRIDIEEVNADGSYGEPVMITDEKTMEIIRKIFKQIKWKPNVESKMAREKDVKATLFYKYDENMPERLFEYQIWFDQNNDTATIISNNEKEGYGNLNKENAQALENILRVKE
ncbi:hypothetical protein ACQKNX_06360 [Lysinibacillus sp. NPDC093712]|uniref:hypothetical protein n=1 Tax=Lysinibacillus sp. NPDC093712 TaxID=3390579 RepID=UPI003D06A79D